MDLQLCTLNWFGIQVFEITFENQIYDRKEQAMPEMYNLTQVKSMIANHSFCKEHAGT